MPKADDRSGPDSLDRRIQAAEARQAVNTQRKAQGDTGDGYRLLADMIGGVLVGLGLGWLLDRYVGTRPWGMVAGLLIGLGFSIFSVVRKASQMSKAAQPPVKNDDPAPAEIERRDD